MIKILIYSEICENIKDRILNEVQCVLNIGIGNEYNELSFISNSYKEAIEAINYKVVMGKNHIICFEDINFPQKEKICFTNDDAERLGFYIKTGLSACSDELIQRVFMKDLINYDIDMMKVVAVNIISVVLKVISDMGLKIDDVYKGYKDLYSEVFMIDNIPDMTNFIKNTTKILVDKINAIKTSK